MSLNNTLLTAEDDLYSTRARDNQFRLLSNRNAGREVYTADTICDALFCVNLGLRYQLQDEFQAENLEKPLDSLAEGCGEVSQHRVVASVDRGYGPLKLLKRFLARKVGDVMIMSKHSLARCPFAAESCVRVSEFDEDVIRYYLLDYDTVPVAKNCKSGESSVADARRPAGDNVKEVPILSLNRHKPYFIDDNK